MPHLPPKGPSRSAFWNAALAATHTGGAIVSQMQFPENSRAMRMKLFFTLKCKANTLNSVRSIEGLGLFTNL